MKSTALPKYWIDGKLVRADKAFLPLTDLAVTRGFGAFEAMRTYHGSPFLLEGHLLRLQKSCELLGLKLPLSLEALKHAVDATLKANKMPESLIRIYVTGGDASGFLPEGRERLLILVSPAKLFPAWQYEKGIALKSTLLGRMIPQAKSLDYTVGIRETLRAVRKGYHEVVFVDEEGNLLEGTQFSVFAVVGKKIISPKMRILPGLTAGYVIDLARRKGFKASWGKITPKVLAEATELFITSSNREIIPAVRLDRKRIGNGKPGPVTRLLHGYFKDETLAR